MTAECPFTAALVDFVWQGTLIAVALQLGLYVSRRRSAPVRYALCATALAALIAAPGVTTASRYNRAEANSSAARWTSVRFSLVTDDEVHVGTVLNPLHDSGLS